ncbi:cation:proton antiporter [Devosia sp.]|uniref:cation:proton antiporter n=1 Tax=Devosia sp. TaxID=1871048 RepID=UPI003A8CB98C
MSGEEAIHWASQISLGLLLLAMLLTFVRLVRGPNLGDRVLALDLLTLLAVGFIAAMAVLTGFTLYIDIAIALALAGFLSTLALARYLLARASDQEKDKT